MILLHNCRQNSAGGKTGAVKRVAKFNFAVLTAEADVATACLIITGVADGADLLVAAHGGNVNLYVVGSCHGSGAVPGGKLNRAEAQAKALYKGFRLYSQFVKGLVGFFGVVTWNISALLN